MGEHKAWWRIVGRLDQRDAQGAGGSRWRLLISNCIALGWPLRGTTAEAACRPPLAGETYAGAGVMEAGY